jgi:hypothetical protein
MRTVRRKHPEPNRPHGHHHHWFAATTTRLGSCLLLCVLKRYITCDVISHRENV